MSFLTRLSRQRPMMRYGIPLIAILMLVFAISYALPSEPPPPKPPSSPPPTAVYEAQVAGIGITEPKSEVIAIGAHLPGVVTHVPVAVGQRVAAGDTLFTIDARAAEAAVAQARAAVEVARAQAADARNQQALFENVSDPRAISKDELSRRRFSAKTATARVTQAEAALNEATTALSRLTVTSPMDATVLSIDIRPGEYAQAGVLQTPLIRLGDVSTMHVRVEVDEADALRVSADAEATAQLRGNSEITVPLQFVRKEYYMEPRRSLTGDGTERVDTRVQQIIYAFDNSEVGAYVGQQMDIFIDTAAGK